jgi:epoxyqueuosine reductase
LPAALTTRIKHSARDAGFDLCGIAPVRDFKELNVFPAWIADGKHGEMKYMEARDEAGELKRASLARVAPWARSVIVCAINYNTAHPYSTHTEDASQGWISRYAWARDDYHDAVLSRLRKIEDDMRELTSGEPAPHFHSRSYVDTGPLMERVYAKYAGIGWIGKNTCIINQKLGSWLFLGVILTSLDCTSVEEADAPAQLEAGLHASDRCGTCTRCIAACPTQAIVAPGVLDAQLCISYLTIEKRGEIPNQLRPGIGRQVYGCDICQDVCPWNRKAPVTSAPEFEAREGLVNPSLTWLAGMQPEEFREVFRKSPVKRAKLSGLRRNAVIAMGNSRNKKFAPTLTKLSEDPDQVVAEHATWALARLD